MKKPFTDEDAAKLVDCVIELARTELTDHHEEPQPVAASCMIAEVGVLGTPSAFRKMDGVKSTSAIHATSKAFTVLLYNADTKKLFDRMKGGVWSEVDMVIMQNTVPQFMPWDGGIQVMDKDGNVLCALGVAGRAAVGDRRLAVLAAHKMGYRTNFDKNGDPLA